MVVDGNDIILTAPENKSNFNEGCVDSVTGLILSHDSLSGRNDINMIENPSYNLKKYFLPNSPQHVCSDSDSDGIDS